ncbi:MAG: alpha/beta fold hydrolase [Planctomycetaceae bacterium]|nr:alpha/beta fold hydrolase [Planctomycetaceae bacterium]
MDEATQPSPPLEPWAERIGLSREAVEDRDFRLLFPYPNNFAAVGDQTMHYLDVGTGDPVVMLHGNPTWSFFYRGLVEGLSDRYRCLAPDHIGCGFSDKPGNYPYSLDTHIRNIETWVETVLPGGEPFTLIVHDWGGAIGMGYAVKHPERIARVVILNTTAFPEGDMPLRIKLCRVPGLGALLVRGLNLFAGLAATQTTVEPLPAPVRKGFILPYNSWANRIAVHRFVQDIPLGGNTRSDATIQAIGRSVPNALAGKPVLIQWGMRDWCFTPFFLGLWKKYVPWAEVDEYPAAGHYLLEDEGEAILARIRKFLERPV